MFKNKYYACHGMSKRMQIASDAIDDEMRRLMVDRLLTKEVEKGCYAAIAKLNRYYWSLKNPTALVEYKGEAKKNA